VARDATKLQAAADSLPGAIRPEIAAVDLSDAASLDSFLATLDARGYVPDVLVNNAGQGASGAFADTGWDKLDAMLRLNVQALGRLSHWAAKGMKARGRRDKADPLFRGLCRHEGVRNQSEPRNVQRTQRHRRACRGDPPAGGKNQF
jgi:NAD(P)-dependent dehydrogenase (short-subunit alcohol dehydrogenase family)